MDIITTQQLTDHPMEDLLDITPCTTVTESNMVLPNVAEHAAYDEKDDEIDSKLEEIYTFAMAAAMDNKDASAQVEGKYKARVNEVTATMLNVALGAIKEKSAIKQHKDKCKVPQQPVAGSKVINNTLVTASFSDIVGMIKGKN